MPQYTGNAGIENTAWGEPVSSPRPQCPLSKRDSGPAPAALPDIYSRAGTAPLAPAESEALPTNPRSREAQALARKQVLEEECELTLTRKVSELPKWEDKLWECR